MALGTLTGPQKAQLCTAVTNAINGNLSFPTPVPNLDDVTDARDAYLQAAAGVAAAKSALQAALLAQKAAEEAMDALLTTLGTYVQTTSGGDEAIILSASMAIRSSGASIGHLPAPASLSVTNGDMPGAFDLHWDSVRGSRSYVVQHSPDPIEVDAVWSYGPPSTKSSCEINGFTSGQRFRFRVAALGAAGQGPWSDPATGRAL